MVPPVLDNARPLWRQPGRHKYSSKMDESTTTLHATALNNMSKHRKSASLSKAFQVPQSVLDSLSPKSRQGIENLGIHQPGEIDMCVAVL